MNNIDPTLARQLKRLKIALDVPPNGCQWETMLEGISSHYALLEEDKLMLHKSLEMASDEMLVFRSTVENERDQLSFTIEAIREAVDSFVDACRISSKSGMEESTTYITDARRKFNVSMATVLSEFDTESQSRDLLDSIRHSFVSMFEQIFAIFGRNDTGFPEDAIQLHRALIPAVYEATNTYINISVWCRQLDEIGGDFWNVEQLSDEQLFASIGDATGHGAAAGLMSATLCASTKTWLRTPFASDLTGMFNALNAIASDVGRKRILATWLGVLFDFDSWEASIINAGHTFPILVREGEVKSIRVDGTPLGAADEVPKIGRIPLQREDTLVLFSDGISEIENPMGEQLNDRRLRAWTKKRLNQNSGKMLAGIVSDIESFRSDERVKDDMTMIVITIKSKDE